MNHDAEIEALRVTQERLVDSVRELTKILQGEGENLGIIAQHRIMWRFHVWLLCSLSAGLGAIATILLKHYLP